MHSATSMWQEQGHMHAHSYTHGRVQLSSAIRCTACETNEKTKGVHLYIIKCTQEWITRTHSDTAAGCEWPNSNYIVPFV